MTTQPHDLKKLREVAEGLAKPAYWFTAGFDDRTGYWFSGSSDGHEGENDLPFVASKAILALLDAYEASARDAEALRVENKSLKSSVLKLYELARRTLHIAYVWNDHNFPHPKSLCRATAEEYGFTSFDDANNFLEDARHATQGD